MNSSCIFFCKEFTPSSYQRLARVVRLCLIHCVITHIVVTQSTQPETWLMHVRGAGYSFQIDLASTGPRLCSDFRVLILDIIQSARGRYEQRHERLGELVDSFWCNTWFSSKNSRWTLVCFILLAMCSLISAQILVRMSLACPGL